ncbi:Alternative oxidase [Drechmeria coniospora]|uniref:Alternative oxidase n=1 Tax=Drechmeria coniospora TaxID=98403 RepID=A0A151GFV5_DRECN|nr:Alternative oxidase [Drechmeria coniospora]KYK55946.1 Alternative oxidase [Drechmeria coniospora]
MISIAVRTRSPASRPAAHLARASIVVASSRCSIIPIPRTGYCAATSTEQGHLTASTRLFSTTAVSRLRDFFPASDTPHIQKTKAAWPHHGYTMDEMAAVVPAHRAPRTVGDWVAWKIVRFARYWMDLATGMDRKQQVDKKNPTTAVEAEKPLTEAQWLIRFVFLESIAGVPGMVGGMLRHLNSLRRMKRDNGWIETLLEESYNERMHLLTFMKMCEPGWFMKLMIIGAQGVFFNSIFIVYLIRPKIVHRFVGYLEEEAVHTYTRAIYEIEQGHLPRWSDPKFRIPDIAVEYWNMPEDHRTMKDLILYIRADEAGHRGVNHTLGNLNQSEDPNPFVSTFKDRDVPKPSLKPAGYERSEVI